MSSSNQEDRPKLRAGRFNKFRSSVPEVSSGGSDRKRAFKRACDKDVREYSPKYKRICPTENITPSLSKPPKSQVISPSKNLANYRLKNLKERIHSSADCSQTKTVIYYNTANTSQETDKSDTNRESIDKKEADLGAKVQHDISKLSCKVVATSSPLNEPKKNIAQERLCNIKKKLSSTNSPCTSGQDKIEKTLSDSLDNTFSDDIKNVTRTKRNITTIGYNSNEDTPYKKCMFRKNNPLSNISRNFIDSDTSVSVENNSLNIVKPFTSTPISERCKIKSVKPFQEVEDLRPESKQESATYKMPTVFYQSSQEQEMGTDNEISSCVSRSDNFFSKAELMSSCNLNSQTPLKSSSEVSLHETTKNSQYNNTIDVCEDMEWSNDDQVEVLQQGESINEEIAQSRDNKEVNHSEKLGDICIVVDTNVFIHGLSKLRDIINMKTGALTKPIIFIPWMVITELDYMKDSCSEGKLKNNIVNAIKFVNSALKDKNPQVIGQTVFEVEKQKHIGPSPDDKIISCCFQAAEKYETVILLSNDTNLKNRAMINDITACSSHEIMMKLMSKLSKNTKSRKIMHKMGILCSSVICECMKSTYGDIWSKMDMMGYPPWSLLECLKRFKKYWGSVFGDKLMKQFTKTVKDLQNVLEINKYITDDSEEFIQFMKHCVALCIFLKDIEECRGFVENTLTEISKIP